MKGSALLEALIALVLLGIISSALLRASHTLSDLGLRLKQQLKDPPNFETLECLTDPDQHHQRCHFHSNQPNDGQFDVILPW